MRVLASKDKAITIDKSKKIIFYLFFLRQKDKHFLKKVKISQIKMINLKSIQIK